MDKTQNLVDVVKNRYKHSRTGHGVMICCPFHDDKNASMLVTSDYAYCFACGKGWTPKKFLRAIGVDSDNIYIPPVRVEREEIKRRYPSSRAILAYEKMLWNLPEKLSFFEARGIMLDVVRKYRIGYFRPPLRACKSPRFTFPAWDEDGKLITVSYRQDPSMQYSDTGNDSKKYLNYPGAPLVLYNMHSLRNYDWFVYVGGQIDALSLLQYDIPTVGAIGEGTFNSRWASAIGNKKVFILLDNDEAGRAGAKKVHSHLLDSVVVNWPEGLPDKYDINAAIMDRFFGIEEVGLLLRHYGADI
jgi:DNA primase